MNLTVEGKEKTHDNEKNKKSDDSMENINSKNHLNDKLSKIQASLQTFISENEF